ncbi:hypothetical protein [Pseudomonas sp. zfem002]|uniref:hypothetical protein n=1 Tax=Pseudomonas sp. zfem002 TaxID=3078197 RepID=UPI00292801C3|nr:hypothetical protein [Pseudomonas sp. zfem002]MDU9392567.1 hypothetical protein [Pseudomonas sp. zfem002]
MTNQPRTTVVGHALLSFFPEIDASTRELVQTALLFAQRATDDVLADGLVKDGYAYYRNQLKSLGWDATPPPLSYVPDLRRCRMLDAALAQIGAVTDQRMAEVTRFSIDRLQRSGKALLRFEERSLERSAFQLLPCRVSQPGYVDLVLYHQTLESADRCRGFLFFERVATGARADLVRFNPRLFETTYAGRLRERLTRALLEEIHEL